MGRPEPDELGFMREQVLGSPAPSKRETIFDVHNETTLQGCEHLARDDRFFNIGALNFASARNPGGGFLRGAHAQEESLARSSGLYPNLKKCTSYYTIHRNQRTALYSDRMIYSTCCPVFRTDDGALLEDYYLVDFITSPAPNAGVIRQ